MQLSLEGHWPHEASEVGLTQMHADKAMLAVLSVIALSSGQLVHVLEEYPSLKRPLEHGEQLNCVPLLNHPGVHGTHDPKM